MAARLRRNPLLQYAAGNRGNHARLSPERVIIDQILEFLGQDSNFVYTMVISQYCWGEYSQEAPKNFPRLCAVSCFGLVETADLLLQKGADIESKTSDRRAALSVAASNGHEAVVKLLLEKGADAEAKNQYGQTALYAAASKGHQAVVKLLLEKGADTEAKDSGGRTVLCIAAKYGHEVVAKLLEKGADAEAKNQYERTALSIATSNRHEAVVKLLEASI